MLLTAKIKEYKSLFRAGMFDSGTPEVRPEVTHTSGEQSPGWAPGAWNCSLDGHFSLLTIPPLVTMDTHLL